MEGGGAGNRLLTAGGGVDHRSTPGSCPTARSLLLPPSWTHWGEHLVGMAGGHILPSGEVRRSGNPCMPTLAMEAT